MLSVSYTHLDVYKRQIYNAKTEYYSQLQRISDSLVSLHSLGSPQLSHLVKTIKKSLGGTLDAKINNTESRLIYLKNLSRLKDTLNENQILSCSICLGEVEIGAIIKCGHYFCKNCILTWLRAHSKCPICKSVCSVSVSYTHLDVYKRQLVSNVRHFFFDFF